MKSSFRRPHTGRFFYGVTPIKADKSYPTMRKTSVDIGVNWVSWLRDQAAKYYIWDEKAQYHRVLHPCSSLDVSPNRTLRDAWQKLPRYHQSFPHLHSNLFIRQLNQMRLSERTRVSIFFAAHGLKNFEFLNHGGRAITFRALHMPTGQIRVARMEAQHSGRFPRPDHSVILQPFATNEGHFHFYGDVKLEILPEVVPLSRLYLEINEMNIPLVRKAFQDAVYDLSWGTNMMYGTQMFDRDAEAQNVGVLPDGRIVSFDPEVVRGARAENKHRHFNTPALLRDASTQQLALIYPRRKLVMPL